VDRWACVDIPAFALQVLLRRRPELRGRAVALVDREVCHAPVRLLSTAARRAGVRVGMKAPAACALCPGLEVALVPPAEIDAAVEEVAALLRACSPRVEVLPPPAVPPAGGPASTSVLLDPTGLERLFGSEQSWAARIVVDLGLRGFRARVALATSRLAALVLARSAPTAPAPGPRRAGGAPQRVGSVVQLPRAEEPLRVRALPVALLGLAEEHQETLARLGVTTIGAFLDLPAGGLVRRFGAELGRVRRALLGDDPTPLAPHGAPPSYDVIVDVEPPDHDATRLLFLARRALAPLLARLAAAGLALGALRLTLEIRSTRRGETTATSLPDTCRLEPATPCLDDRLVTDLLRLHLDSLRLAEPVETLVLRPETAPASPEQLALFAGRARESAAALSRAVARVRAAYGPDSVVRARLGDSHVPESAWRWEPLARVAPPAAPSPATPSPATPSPTTPPATVVRAVLPRARRLGPPPPPTARAVPAPVPAAAAGAAAAATPPPAGPVPLPAALTTATALAGPHLVEGGWWETPVRRAYHYVATRGGDVLWVFHDADRGEWFVQGEV
jgi:protein ImuB